MGDYDSSTNLSVFSVEDCWTWPRLSRLLVPQSDILDWSTDLYKGPGRMISQPSSLYYRPFHILISSNKDASVLRIQRFEYRSPASVLSLGLLGSKDIEPKDCYPVTIWYLAATQEIAKTMLILDMCQTVRNGGVKRAERQYSISRVATPLTPVGIQLLQNQFQIEFCTTTPAGWLEKIVLQLSDEVTDQGCSVLLQRFGRHLKSRQLPLYPRCAEWALLQETISRVDGRMMYKPRACPNTGVSYMQPDGIYEEMIIATSPDLAKRLLGCPNPYVSIMAYRKERLLCIQMFHTQHSQIQYREQPDKKFPKHEMWIGADEGLPAFIRMLRIYQVIDGGGNAVEYSKRISVFSVEKFFRAGHLPTDRHRVFVLPFGQGAKLQFGFSQFSGDNVGYCKYASVIGEVFLDVVSGSETIPPTPQSRGRPPMLVSPPVDSCLEYVVQSEAAEKSDAPPDIRIPVAKQLEKCAPKERSLTERERWAWTTPQHSFRGVTGGGIPGTSSTSVLGNQPTIC